MTNITLQWPFCTFLAPKEEINFLKESESVSSKSLYLHLVMSLLVRRGKLKGRRKKLLVSILDFFV